MKIYIILNLLINVIFMKRAVNKWYDAIRNSYMNKTLVHENYDIVTLGGEDFYFYILKP